MSCKYNNCKICGYKSECEIYKENAELKQAEKGKVVEHFEAYGQCRDSRRIAELEKENERLTASYETLKLHDEEEIGMLKSENAELKEKLEVVIALKDEEVGCVETDFNTFKSKAKEIIKKFSKFVNNDVEYDPEHPQEYTDLWNKLCEEAEQFLSEVEK